MAPFLCLVPNNLPADRVEQNQLDAAPMATLGEERDGISTLNRPNDLDPVYAIGENGYRLYGDKSKRNGVNHSTVGWYAWRMSRDALA